jgi:protein O-GlcNAc transferase
MFDRMRNLLARAGKSAVAHLKRRGDAFLERGDWEQAATCYRQLIAVAPGELDARLNLGYALIEQKRPDEAQEVLRRALEIDPHSVDALFMLGGIAHARDDLRQAAWHWGRLQSIQPDFERVYGGLFHSLFRSGQIEKARAIILEGLRRYPDTAEFHYYLGNLQAGGKEHDAAIQSFERALALEPGSAELHNDLGVALQAQGRVDEAIVSYGKAFALRPDFAEALINHGGASAVLYRYDEALSSYDRALQIQSDSADALSARGNLLVHMKRYDDAIASYEQALRIRPDDVQTLFNHGTALSCAQRYEDAARSVSRALEIDPDYAYGVGQLFSVRIFACDWSGYAAEAAAINQSVSTGKNAMAPFPFLAVARSAAIQRDCARIYAAENYPASRQPLWTGERYRHEKIRVAYLSADFHDHATAYLMAEMFEVHDRTRFETTAISFGPDSKSDMRKRLQRSFDRFVDVRDKTDREIALLLREMEIDIAVDLKGFTTDSRMGILAHRAAPVQVNYLGYPGTLGVDYIDYIVADRYVIPAEHRHHYTEKVVWLPDSYQVNDSKRRIAGRKPTRQEAGLPPSGFVFCCFNNNYKITPDIFDRWMNLLNRVTGSVLWLLEDNADASRNLRKEAASRGVNPDRLVFAPRMELDEHLARHQLADLFLDTLPYNAHTTASDALWAGLPVLTCTGDAFAGRVAAGLLAAAGLPELIAHDLDEYEALALKIALTPSLLDELRAKLARNRAHAPLFDAGRFCRHIEQAYIAMWERAQRGEPPAHLEIDPV